MNVEMTGKMQFFCESTDGTTKYTVDLEENYPNGKCSCTDFGARCQKAWNEARVVSEYSEPTRTRCKHINGVVMWLGNAVINRAAH